MSDFAEYLEATTGTAGGVLFDTSDDSSDLHVLDEGPGLYDTRDAVLCLVDARPSMFANSPASPASASCAADDAPPREKATPTAFTYAMRAVKRLYHEKIGSSEHDLLGLVLYNTAQQHNPIAVPGVYLLHSLDTLGIDRLREVEELEMAGTVGSAAYHRFIDSIGHRPEVEPTTLEDALRLAQFLLQRIGAHTAVPFRRIFLYSDDDNPTRGDTRQSERCADRVRVLREEAVALEVLGVSSGHASGGGAITASPRSFQRGVFWDPLLAAAAPPSTWPADSLCCPATAAINSATTEWPSQLYGGGVYVQTVESPGAESDDGGAPNALDALAWAVHPQRPIQHCALYIGAPHSHAHSECNNNSSDEGLMAAGVPPAAAAAAAVPRMSVSVFAPIMAAHGAKTEWLERGTNTLLRRQAQYAARMARRAAPSPSDAEKEGEEEEDEGERAGPALDRDKLRYQVVVGGHALPFSQEERAQVAAAAAAGAPVGLTILCFKPLEDVARLECAVQRSSFLHANTQDGGEGSLRLFVQLVRTLRKQGKAAVALYVRGATVAPRLVALVPSSPSPAEPTAYPCAACLRYPVESWPAEGMGLYVVPLPYAEDVRPVPAVGGHPAAVAPPASGRADAADGSGTGEVHAAVSAEQLAAAQRVVSAMTVAYDVAAVPNPLLSRQYYVLKRLAAGHAPSSLCGADSSRWSQVVAREAARAVEDDAPLDYTQPDWKGIHRHASLFRAFSARVLEPTYDAHALCPQPRAAGCGAAVPRRTRATAEDACGDVEELVHTVEQAAGSAQLHSLTAAQLRAYLRAVKAGGGGAKRKELLVSAVEDAARARRVAAEKTGP